MKRIKILIVSVLCILAAGCLLVGCKRKSANNKVGTKVVYCLEGGSFMNSTSDIVVYYQFPNDNLRKIPYKETTNYETVPKLDSKQAGEFEKSGCYIEGWYRVKNVGFRRPRSHQRRTFRNERRIQTLREVG